MIIGKLSFLIYHISLYVSTEIYYTERWDRCKFTNVTVHSALKIAALKNPSHKRRIISFFYKGAF
jgi:hypothetical protein